MDKRRGKKRIWLRALAIPVGALLAVLGILYLAGSGIRSRPDDARAIVESYDPTAFTGLSFSSDGRATLRLEKNDIYWFGTKYGIFDRLLEKSGAGEELRGMDFSIRLDNGELTVSMHRRILGFVPILYKTRVSAASMGPVITLTPREVVLDNAIVLPESWWPESFCRSYTLDFSDCNISDAITTVRFSGNALIIETEGLSGIVEGTLEQDEELFEQFGLYGYGTQDTFGLFRWLSEQRPKPVSVEEALGRVCATGDAENAMVELLSGCTEESCTGLCEGRSPFFREYILGPLIVLRDMRRAGLADAFAAEAQRYEKLLTAAREMYRAGRLTFHESYWLNTANGTRIVLLTADVGSGSEICTSDMPAFRKIPAYRPSHVKGMDLDQVYDLGVVMTTAGGKNVLLHFRQDGTMTMDPLSTDEFIALLVAKRQPIVDVGKLSGK